MKATTLPAEGFAREKTVLAVIPISRSMMWAMVKGGKFPAPIKLSERVTVWRVEDIRAWIAKQK